MTEGGKIDWSCHANDAKTSIMDTIALSDAVQVAIDFAAEHPEETLIIVTADHETGGMTIGFATTAYDTHFNYLENQTISWVQFDDVITEMRDNERHLRRRPGRDRDLLRPDHRRGPGSHPHRSRDREPEGCLRAEHAARGRARAGR